MKHNPISPTPGSPPPAVTAKEADSVARKSPLSASNPFDGLPRNHFKAIYADPAWRFACWSGKGTARSADNHYDTMTLDEICALPVSEIAADDCVLFLWACWPMLPEALKVIDAWGFSYKTCGFDWMKANNRQPDMFREEADVQVGMGYDKGK